MTRILKAILFDWDFTLGRVLGDYLLEELLAKLLEGKDLIFKPQEIKAAISARVQLINDRKLIGNLDPQTKEEIINFYQQILSLLGYKHPTRKLASQLRDSYATLPFGLYDDTLPTLQELSKLDNMQLGIITNHSRRVLPTILSLVGQYIPKKNIIISDAVGVYKPDPEIFKIGAKRVGTVPSACMYVGDNLITDIIGALDKGGFAKALWLHPTNKIASVSLPSGTKIISQLANVIKEVF